MDRMLSPVDASPSGLDLRRLGVQRTRRAVLTAGVNVAAKLVVAATLLVTIPMTREYLGAERFGFWMTIGSLTALLVFADFGIGNGLLNAIASASGRDDRVGMRRQIASALVMVSVVGILVAGVLASVVWTFDLDRVFGVHEPAARADVRPSLLAFLLCLFLGLQAGVVQRVLSGLQRGVDNGVLGIVGQTAAVLCLLAAISQSAGLPWLVISVLGVPSVVTIAGGWLWLWAREPDLVPRRGDADVGSMRALATAGALFFVLQLAASLAFASDNLIGSASAGAVAVGDFAIAAKLFGVVSMVVSIVIAPLWPAYGEALSRGDSLWVRRTLIRSVMMSAIVACVASTALWQLFDLVTGMWLGRALPISQAMLAGFAAWTVVSAVGIPVAVFLNGAQVVRAQVVIAVVFALSCLGLKLLLTPTHGLVILPWVTTVLYLTVVLVSYAWLVPRALARRGSGLPSGVS